MSLWDDIRPRASVSHSWRKIGLKLEPKVVATVALSSVERQMIFRRNSVPWAAMLMIGRLSAFAASFGAGRLRRFIRGHIDGKDKTLAVAADPAEAAIDRTRQSEKHLRRADPERRRGLHIRGHHHEVVRIQLLCAE